ncbi:MAG TPA: 4-hydroxy-tetrahydrodipicolinate synthase [Nitriliruptorales bacterium]|nr:4-hydroxy-tetrahydrodipicolinate synthase [Nitriliruptorales bacterium]
MASSTPHFGRVVTAMVTPFDGDGALDLDGAARLAAHLADHGTDTVLVCGTTGEGPTVPEPEQLDLLRAVRDAVGHRARVLLGTGTNDTRTSCERSERATAAGADGLLVVTPYYNKPDQRGLLRHFRAVAGSTDLPVILYDIPGRTGRQIAVDTLLELAEVDNIVAVKDAALDLEKTALVAARSPDGFQIYSGQDALNLPILAVGGVGFISVAAHIVGSELADMAASFDADPVKAREIHLRLMPLFQALFLDPNPAPLKAILNDLGLPAGPLRPPLATARDSTLRALQDALDLAGIPRR